MINNNIASQRIINLIKNKQFLPDACNNWM